MGLGSLPVGLEVVAALFTLLYMGRLLFEDPSESGRNSFEKRSLRNQRICRKA